MIGRQCFNAAGKQLCASNFPVSQATILAAKERQQIVHVSASQFPQVFEAGFNSRFNQRGANGFQIARGAVVDKAGKARCIQGFTQ